MLAKTIKYTDYNGVERKETHYFNYSKAEIAEMELSTAGGLSEMIKKITEAQDGPSIMKLFKDIILGSYGVSDFTVISLCRGPSFHCFRLPIMQSQAACWVCKWNCTKECCKSCQQC